MAKRLGKKSTRMKLYDTSVGKNMSVAQLKTYIRKATIEVNKTIGKRGTGSEQLDKSIKYLQSVGGIKNIKDKNKNIVSKIGLGFTGKRKSDLIRQARMLKQHIGFDIESRSGKEFFSERELRAYKSFEKNTGIKLSKTDYRQLVDIFGDLGTTIVQQLTSDQIADMYSRKDNMGSADFIAVVKDTYMEHKNDGLTKTQMLELINDKLKEALGG